MGNGRYFYLNSLGVVDENNQVLSSGSKEHSINKKDVFLISSFYYNSILVENVNIPEKELKAALPILLKSREVEISKNFSFVLLSEGRVRVYSFKDSLLTAINKFFDVKGRQKGKTIFLPVDALPFCYQSSIFGFLDPSGSLGISAYNPNGDFFQRETKVTGEALLESAQQELERTILNIKRNFPNLEIEQNYLISGCSDLRTILDEKNKQSKRIEQLVPKTAFFNPWFSEKNEIHFLCERLTLASLIAITLASILLVKHYKDDTLFFDSKRFLIDQEIARRSQVAMSSISNSQQQSNDALIATLEEKRKLLFSLEKTPNISKVEEFVLLLSKVNDPHVSLNDVTFGKTVITIKGETSSPEHLSVWLDSLIKTDKTLESVFLLDDVNMSQSGGNVSFVLNFSRNPN
jgi:hypothetical protein